MEIDIQATVEKLRNSGFGWISKEDLIRMVKMIITEIQPPIEIKNEWKNNN